MISEISPSASVVLSGAGAGQVALGPPSGTRWQLRLATVLVSTATLQPQCLFYRGSPSGPQTLIDSTFTGAQASSGQVAGAPYFPGQLLWAVWTGGDPGAVATLQAYGQQGVRGDPFEAAPVGAGFADPVVAGTTLIREAIQSANYVPGVSGWTINRDGTVEFASATIRGDLKVVSLVDTSYIWITDNPNLPEILFNVEVPGKSTGLGIIQADFDGSGVTAAPFIALASPAILPSNSNAVLTIESAASDLSTGSFIDLSASFVTSGPIFPRVSGVAETWHTAGPVNGWSATGDLGAGVGAAYRLLAAPANSVEVRIAITGGTTAANTTIFTLPVGYRPAHKHLLPMVTGTGACRVSFNTNGTVVIDGAAAAQPLFFGATIPLDL